MTNPFKIMKITNPYKVANKKYSAGHHTGIDFVGQDTKNVKAVMPGSIYKTGYSPSDYGNYIVQKVMIGGSIKYIWYCHLSKILKTSGTIKEGEIIGVEGSSGNSTGSHLHLELRNSTNLYGKDENIASLLNIENKVSTVQELRVTTNGANLNVRKTPNGEIVDKWKNGSVVNVFEVFSGWGRTNKGWCSLEYLK